VRELRVPSADVELAARESGDPDGAPVVVMHGLLATREHVLMGSTRLEDAGLRVIAYDARGHGCSTAPHTNDGYDYELWLADLVAVIDAFELERPLLLGVSAGAHTALRLAIEQPERVRGIVAATPAYDPDNYPDREAVRKADKLAAGLRHAGVPGFVEALEPPPAWGSREQVFRQVMGRRLRGHGDLEAVAGALEGIWRSRPFGSLDLLESVRVPTVVVGSRDDYEVDHPHALAVRYATALETELRCERAGKLPLAWNGGALATCMLDVAARAGALEGAASGGGPPARRPRQMV
jgi:pimeloyl-ACP methyl ester carboxylesterase